MTTYFRPYINSGWTNIYTDSGVTYHIDWILVSEGWADASVVIVES